LGKYGGTVVNTVLLCPGQGAQRVGMGKDLAVEFPEARRVFEQVDEALGVSLSDIMWNGPEEELTLTHNAQPAILAHTLAAYAVLGDALSPVAGAGHSLGEYSAYVAAGTLGIVDATHLVRRRGELMLEAGQQRPGTMTAVLGLDAARVQSICVDCSGECGVVVAANINAPDQTVISGDPAAVEQAGAACKQAGAKRVMPLKVSGAFHSPLMIPAQAGLRAELNAVSFSDPNFPVVANATAEPITDSETARLRLDEQLTSPVRWVASMQRAADECGENTRFVEVGPGKVLSGLVKRIVAGASTVSLGTVDDLRSFLEATE
jgi:[acyl-carrier-protein] S-malonyltransferase